MSNSNNSENNVGGAAQPIESIDQILNNIKDAITSSDATADDVLVLTDKIPEDNVPPLPSTSTDNAVNASPIPIPNEVASISDASSSLLPPVVPSIDILDQIDAGLNNQSVSAPLPVQDMKITPEKIMLEENSIPAVNPNNSSQFQESSNSNALNVDSTVKSPTQEAPPLSQAFASDNTSLINNDVASSVKSTITSMLGADFSKPSNTQNSNSLLSKTLEDVVVTLLKKEIQSWLNDNLENMVKKIVEQEIKQLMPK